LRDFEPGEGSIGRLRHTARRSWSTAVLAAGALLTATFVVQACASLPPQNLDDLCSIFEERATWERAAGNTREKWGVPESVLLAMLHQESRFRSAARPGWRRVFGIFPVGRLSSAYGYGQVKDGTWDDYQDATGRAFARRTDFSDVADFVGWYARVIGKVTEIKPDDAYNLYLAYHEGPAGYARGSYREKKWLQGVARKVQARADLYAIQHQSCGGPDLESGTRS